MHPYGLQPPKGIEGPTDPGSLGRIVVAIFAASLRPRFGRFRGGQMNAQQPVFSGIYPMQYAFFARDGGLDRAAMRRQVQGCIGGGAHGVAVLGLGTEVNKLSEAERRAAGRLGHRGRGGAGPGGRHGGRRERRGASCACCPRAGGRRSLADLAASARARSAGVPLRAVLRAGDGAGGLAGRDSERPRIHRGRPVRRLPVGAGPHPAQLRAAQGRGPGAYHPPQHRGPGRGAGGIQRPRRPGAARQLARGLRGNDPRHRYLRLPGARLRAHALRR